MVYGPAAHTTSIEHLNTSSADIHHLINRSGKSVPDTKFFAFVDITDVSKAHARAFEVEVEEAEGQRYLVTAGRYTYNQVCEVILKEFTEKKGLVPEPVVGEKFPGVYGVVNGKVRGQLGMEFIRLEKCITDQARKFIEMEKKSEL